MLKFLKGVVAGSGAGLKDLPYNIGEPYSSAWGSWTHSRGTSKARSGVGLGGSGNLSSQGLFDLFLRSRIEDSSILESLIFNEIGVHLGTNVDDGSPVSIFSLSGSNAQDGHLAAGRNGVKRLRIVSYQ
ncbi:hypothetical protein CK203_016607 [Vitis vinifera]|uniref:Uncharacterized protein n=1 Tax=Vitis vinifera TaxID=29760 RepID=A0A438J2A0_VITVI|nr:hypothetical protein CK203_016607 [Vitis vinifera]